MQERHEEFGLLNAVVIRRRYLAALQTLDFEAGLTILGATNFGCMYIVCLIASGVGTAFSTLVALLDGLSWMVLD